MAHREKLWVNRTSEKKMMFLLLLFFNILWDLPGTNALYFGKKIGPLSELNHGVKGVVYAVDSRTIHIKDFSYDGAAPDAFFYTGLTGEGPHPDGIIIPDDKGGKEPLKGYHKRDVTLTLPDGLTLKDIPWFAVWCREYAVNFGHVVIPKNFDYPRPQKIDALPTYDHGVASEKIVVVDAQTFLIPNFRYDGAAPDAFFWVGTGKPSPAGTRVPDENGSLNPLRAYTGKTIVITLPGDLTVFDIDHLGVWCRAFGVDFGHVIIPQNLNVPPSLKMLGVAPQKLADISFPPPPSSILNGQDPKFLNQHSPPIKHPPSTDKHIPLPHESPLFLQENIPFKDSVGPVSPAFPSPLPSPHPPKPHIDNTHNLPLTGPSDLPPPSLQNHFGFQQQKLLQRHRFKLTPKDAAAHLADDSALPPPHLKNFSPQLKNLPPPKLQNFPSTQLQNLPPPQLQNQFGFQQQLLIQKHHSDLAQKDAPLQFETQKSPVANFHSIPPIQRHPSHLAQHSLKHLPHPPQHPTQHLPHPPQHSNKHEHFPHPTQNLPHHQQNLLHLSQHQSHPSAQHPSHLSQEHISHSAQHIPRHPSQHSLQFQSQLHGISPQSFDSSAGILQDPSQLQFTPNVGSSPGSASVHPFLQQIAGNHNHLDINRNSFRSNQHQLGLNQHQLGLNQHQLRPNHQQLRLNQHQFGSNQHQFEPNQHQFGPNQHRFGLNQHQFEPNQHRFGLNQHQLGLRQSQLGLGQHRFSSNQHQFEPNQAQFVANEPQLVPNQFEINSFGPNQFHSSSILPNNQDFGNIHLHAASRNPVDHSSGKETILSNGVIGHSSPLHFSNAPSNINSPQFAFETSSKDLNTNSQSNQLQPLIHNPFPQFSGAGILRPRFRPFSSEGPLQFSGQSAANNFIPDHFRIRSNNGGLTKRELVAFQTEEQSVPSELKGPITVVFQDNNQLARHFGQERDTSTTGLSVIRGGRDLIVVPLDNEQSTINVQRLESILQPGHIVRFIQTQPTTQNSLTQHSPTNYEDHYGRGIAVRSVSSNLKEEDQQILNPEDVDVEVAIEADVEAAVEVDVDADALEAAVNVEAEADADAEAESAVNADTEAAVDADAEAAVDADAEAAVDADAEAAVDANAEADMDAEAEADLEATVKAAVETAVAKAAEDKDSTKLNCEVLYDDLAFEVRWAVAGDSIVMQLVGKVDDGEYMAFGLSGADSRSVMIGGDVTVAWLDQVSGKGEALDYDLIAKSQCQGGTGSCPDSKTGNKNNVRLLNAAFINEFTMLTFQRPLNGGDRSDKSFNVNRPQAVIWAIGPVNSQGDTSYHRLRSNGDMLIDFGRSPKWNCPLPDEQIRPVSTRKPIPSTKVAPAAVKPVANPWHIPPIPCYEPEDGVFYAQIGPTGGDKGYNAITGHVGWGIAWYINGLLIPEINVVRGKTYTFVVEGGANSNSPAKYHPFYISDDPEGGYEFKTKAERAKVQVYAGVEHNPDGSTSPTAFGRLCEWKADTAQPASNFDSFGGYQRTLTLDCQEGQPGILQWTPDRNTPDTVYYQCFTHRFLGWKINVVDACDGLKGNLNNPGTIQSFGRENRAGRGRGLRGRG